MTGTVTWESVTYILGFGGIVAAACWWLYRVLEALRKDIAERFDEQREASDERFARLEDRLRNLEIEVARDYISKSTMKEMLDPVVAAIDGVRRNMQHLSERLDRWIGRGRDGHEG